MFLRTEHFIIRLQEINGNVWNGDIASQIKEKSPPEMAKTKNIDQTDKRGMY